MRIAIVSKSDQTGGGASRVATELADLLLDAGYPVDHWTARSASPTKHPLRKLYGAQPLIRTGILAAHLVQRRLGAPELLPVELINPGFKRLLEADVIHVHDITNALSPWSMSWLAVRKPLIWTLHDCSPFTGGCLYPMGCGNFSRSCGNCPQHGVWPLNGFFDASWLLQQEKKSFVKKAKFVAVAPSQWMANIAQSSGFFPRPRVISNGIDLTQFAPTKKADARQFLGIDSSRLVVALCAGNLGDDRKGIRYALSVLRAAKEQNPYVLAIGEKDPILSRELIGLDVRFTGFISDRKNLASCYCAADALLFCSMADNQPLTVMESMACGTPIVGFSSGGVPELVTHLVDGYLVAPGNHAALESVIGSLLDNRGLLHRWSRAAHQRAVASFGYGAFLDAHVSLYEEAIASSVLSARASCRAI